jgi:hypothetical protein
MAARINYGKSSHGSNRKQKKFNFSATFFLNADLIFSKKFCDGFRPQKFICASPAPLASSVRAAQHHR